jgi:hypothetical protein
MTGTPEDENGNVRIHGVNVRSLSMDKCWKFSLQQGLIVLSRIIWMT